MKSALLEVNDGKDSVILRRNQIYHQTQRHYSDLICPCCGKKTDSPALKVVIDQYGLTKKQAKILTAVWNGGGLAVSSGKIFDEMYADDYDGGPSISAMYSSLKILLCRTREKLNGSGVNIETLGPKKGYRLVLGEKENGRISK